MRSTIVLLALLAICGAVVGLGQVERDISLFSVAEIWAEVIRDADELSLKPFLVAPAEESALGARLDQSMTQLYPVDRTASATLQNLGQKIEPHCSRKGIQYHYSVLSTPEVNAFSLPGGYVYVTAGMLSTVQSQDELAFVLAHEMAHVDSRHCLQRRKAELLLRRVDAAPVGANLDALRGIIAMTFDQKQETEADAQALRMATQAGFSPSAGAALLQRLSANAIASSQGTMPGEVLGSASRVMQEYLATHPNPTDRVLRLRQLQKQAPKP